MVVQLDGGEVLWHFKVTFHRPAFTGEKYLHRYNEGPIQIISGSENKCVHVRRADLQLYGARGVLQQRHSLRVAHAFSRGATDTDDAVANLEK